ncbi:MAG: exosome complex RNA-binding protein Rrp4 [Candidatus Njordarchaeota archaeon]
MRKAMSTRIVVPGEIVGSSNYIAKGAIFTRPDGKIVATRVGLLRIKGREINVVPLAGFYIPERGDSVIGIVVDYSIVYWLLEINYVWRGRLDVPDFTKRPFDASKEKPEHYLKIGDVVYAKVANVERGMMPILTCREKGYGKLEGGRLISINPVKIPRVIGIKSSMLEAIKNITKAEMKVGANGIIWIKAEKPEIEELVENAIKRIEKESHTSGLTKRIQNELMRGMHKIQRGGKK